jgi:hypothetical protein
VTPTDPYLDDVYRWWHLGEPPPELLAAASDGWLTRKGTAIDIGCGLGIEAAYLASGHYDRNPVGGKSPNRTRAAHRSWR